MKSIVIHTNAPPEYDYSYVIVLDAEYAKYTGTGGTHPIIRKITIPEEYVDYQCGRYGSGLYSSLTQEQFYEQIDAGLIEGIKTDDVRRIYNRANLDPVESVWLVIAMNAFVPQDGRPHFDLMTLPYLTWTAMSDALNAWEADDDDPNHLDVIHKLRHAQKGE